MNDRRQMRFVEWLQDGPNRGPEDGLAEVFAVTRSMSQRPPLLGQWLTCRRIWAPSSTGCPGPRLRRLVVLLLIALLVAFVVGAPPPLPDPLARS